VSRKIVRNQDEARIGGGPASRRPRESDDRIFLASKASSAEFLDANLQRSKGKKEDGKKKKNA